MSKLRVALAMPDDFSLWQPRRGLITYLAERGVDVVLLSRPGPLVARLEALGAVHVPIGPERLFNPVADARYMWDVYRYLRAHPVDVLHAMTTKPAVLATLAAKAAGTPTVVASIEGLGRALTPGNRGLMRLAGLVLSAAYWVTGRVANRTRFMNPDDYEYFIQHNLVRHARAVLIVGEGADPAEHAPNAVSPARIAELRAQWGSVDTRFVVMPARAIAAKGVNEFIAAAEMLHARDPRIRCLLVGGADTGPGVVAESVLRRHEGPAFAWTGFWPDLREMFALADVVTLPSYLREGVPNTLIEAMLMAKPIVTTDSAGCRELVVPGKNGLLVPPRDPLALMEALWSILSDSTVMKAMAAHSRERAIELWDVAVTSRRIVEELYQLPVPLPGGAPA